MNEKIQKTLKSAETEDWLDLHVVRPFCYWWAVLFAKLDIHPNTVTILSMFIGAGSTFFFAYGSFIYEGTHGLVMNIIAILLLCLADIFDCTDGLHGLYPSITDWCIVSMCTTTLSSDG